MTDPMHRQQRGERAIPTTRNALAAVLVACAMACAPAGAMAATTPAATPADKPHPALKVTTFDGKPWDLAAQRGHWVVVNYWATWCGPCLTEMPDLSAFIAKRKDVTAIGLAFEEIERADMAAFLKKHKPGYPVAIVDTYHPPADFATPRGLPVSYLIDPEGNVAHKFLGPLTVKELQQMIDRARNPAA